MSRITVLRAALLAFSCIALGSSCATSSEDVGNSELSDRVAIEDAWVEAERWLGCTGPGEELTRTHYPLLPNILDPNPSKHPTELARRLEASYDAPADPSSNKYVGVRYEDKLFESADMWLLGGSKEGARYEVIAVSHVDGRWIMGPRSIACSGRLSG
jgi:hypothetical protein